MTKSQEREKIRDRLAKRYGVPNHGRFMRSLGWIPLGDNELFWYACRYKSGGKQFYIAGESDMVNANSIKYET